MIRLKHFFAVVTAYLFVISIGSCRKEGKSEFQLNRSEYAAGEQLEINNLTSSKKQQSWDILNSSEGVTLTTEDRNPNMVIPLLTADGTYTLVHKTKLSGGRESISSKSFMVKTVRGYLMVKGTGVNKEFVVFADNQYIGKSSYYSSDTKYVQVKLPLGTRFIEIRSATGEGTQYVTVEIEESDSQNITFNP